MNEVALVNNITLLSSLTVKSFESVAKNLKEQQKLNRGFTLISILATAYIIMLHKKIEQLSDEVKELKQTMEE